MSQYLPALQVPIDTVFLSDLFGFILAMAVAIFVAFWIGMVMNRRAMVLGTFIGGVIGFLIILGWLGTLIYTTPYPGAEGNGVSIFFGSFLFNSALGLAGGIILDLIVTRRRRAEYRRREPVHE